MKKWIVIAVLVAIAAPVLGARQTVVRTDPFGTGWTKQNSMNTELYQKTDPTETGFTGMDGEVITSGVVPSAKNLSPDKVSGVPSINFLYEANGTDTNGFGFLGPLNSSKNILYRISDESPAYGNVLTVDSVVADQTITVGGGSMVADVVTLILSESAGGSVSDDAYSSAWDGVTTIGASKNALYDKISALETQVADMIAAFSAAGLNSFSFDPVTTFPLYSNTATPSISVDVTDASTTYAVASVLYKIDAGEYTGNTMTNTAGNTWAATLSTLSEGSHDIRFQASDDKSTPNTGESAAYAGAIVVDLTNPAIGAITPSALTHDGTGTTLTATIASVTETNENYRQWSLYDVTDTAIQTDWTTFTGLSISGITIPADQHTYRVDVRVYDLAGNVGSASSSNIVYQAVAVNPTYSWPCSDSAASTAVVADNGGVNGVLLNGGNTSDIQTGTGFAIPDSAYVYAAVPDTVMESGVFSIQGRFKITRAISTGWAYLFSESSAANQFVLMWSESTHLLRLYTNGVDRGWSVSGIDLQDGTNRYIRLTHNGAEAKVYAGTTESSMTLVHTWTSATPTNIGGTARFGGAGAASNTVKGEISDWKIWNSVVTP